MLNFDTTTKKYNFIWLRLYSLHMLWQVVDRHDWRAMRAWIVYLCSVVMHRFPRIASEASPAKLCLGKDMSWMPGLTSLHSNGPASSLPYLLDVTLWSAWDPQGSKTMHHLRHHHACDSHTWDRHGPWGIEIYNNY